jgi:hypothetical protein
VSGSGVPLSLTHSLDNDVFLSFYWKEVGTLQDPPFTISNATKLEVSVVTQDGWKFVVY